MPIKPAAELLSPRQVGVILGRHPVVVIRYVHEGRFPHAIVDGEGNGRRYGIPRADVDRYIESRRIGAVA